MLIKSIALVILLSTPLAVHVEDIPYNHDSITLSEIIHKVDFPVLAPDNVPNNWTLEIKGTQWTKKNTLLASDYIL
ncbi:hypothetical protein [Sutcliffiella horikoshii]|uniref:hypothetical protein n=1 Tax=Sutcliffiella horikoshii TaxID=79883 RepID=UPI001F2129A2|nr:hypothetical protein [Sutcliffiella horikoshii]MCG1023396.1 hypothetical protein [Sutcliffiella horikoshii]